MEATVVSLGKAVLDGALAYARSKATEEVAMQLGVEGDVAFIADELEMMQSFLMTADEERGQHKVLATWVKQIRDVAYNVEDSLMDFALYSEKKTSWWCSLHTMGDRRRIAKEVKELRTKVEDVSNRNLRYRLITESSGPKSAVREEQVCIASAAMFGINEARLAALEKEKSKVDLHQLITSNDVDLRVIALWGTTGDLGKASTIQEVYNDPKIALKFGFRAWVRLTRPFNPNEFIHSLVRQNYENFPEKLAESRKRETVGSNVLMKMENMSQSDMIDVFDTQVNDSSYLIVIDDLSTIVEWSCIKRFFPDNKKRSRMIVNTQQAEIASLCTEQPYQVSELKQFSSDQTLYLFHKKITLLAMNASCCAEPISDSNEVTTAEGNTGIPTSEIQEEFLQPKNAGENKVCNTTATKKFDRSRTWAPVDEILTGRETEKSIMIKLVGQPDNDQGFKVISVWGMGGLGKTTLVRSVYRSQELGGWKRAWATALRPFNPEVLIRDLVLQLRKSIQEYPAEATATGEQKKSMPKLRELKEELSRLLSGQKCLIVLDDISSIFEWELIKTSLESAGRIIITTREKNIAAHCSREYKNMYSLEGLKDDAALDLFIKKVFKDNTETNDLVPAMMEQARLILKKCDGLPLAVSTIGGFLATKPKTVIEWRKMNDRVSSELEINPELRTIKTILMRSYDGLPYHLKSVFLYMSIFPEDYRIRWGRLVKRWIAEGYSRDIHGMTGEELGRMYFDELLDRSIILPGEELNHTNGNINSCQLHDIIREICISKAREENLVFTLEEGFGLSGTQGAIRHLVISSNWERDKDVFKGRLDLSHVRSLTVFGEWRPFFISDNMRFLRVLDMEDTIGLRDHHLDKIGQLLHLKYLSIRGCRNLCCLPNSFSNLRHLQTLDVRGTQIFELPAATITKLQNLQHLRAADYWETYNVTGEADIIFNYRSYTRPSSSECASCRILVHTGPLFLRPQVLDDDLNRHDIFNLYRLGRMCLEENGNNLYGMLYGVEFPRGIGKLKALRTLGVVNVARGKGKGNAIIKELGELTQLRKLGVLGINNQNSMEFWSTIAGHNQLRSLTLQGCAELDVSRGKCLSPPSCLESLKLCGKLGTKWIHQLQNLSKLTLWFALLEQDDAIQALNVLPNLAVLRLKDQSVLSKKLHFLGPPFPSLVVLELHGLVNLEAVLFKGDTMARLEMLQVDCCESLVEISGLGLVTSLREIRLGSGSGICKRLKEEVQREVAERLKHVRLNTI